jgi:PAS domain S-box-containing protein
MYRIIDACLPAEVRNGPPAFARQARLAIGVPLILSTFAIPYALCDIWIGRWGLAIVLLVVGVCALLVPLAYRRTRSHVLAAHLTSLLVLIAIVSSACVSGGAASPVFGWGTVLVLVGLLMADARLAIGWVAVRTMAQGALFLLGHYGLVTFPAPVTLGEHLVLGLSAVTVPLAVLLLGIVLRDAEHEADATCELRQREAMRARDEAQEQERTKRALLDALEEGVYGVDGAGRITFANASACAMLGVTAAELVGRPETEAVGAEMAAAGEGRRAAVRVLAPGGRAFSASMSRRPVGTGLCEWVVAFRDVTAEEQLELGLREAQKLESVGRLAAGVAHEINTPVQFVADNLAFLASVFADLVPHLERVRDGLPDEGRKSPRARLQWVLDETPSAIAQATEGARRVAAIVRSLKEFAHPDGEETDADINRAIENTLTISRNEWKYVASVEVDLDPNLPLVYCNVGELNQVILNLVVNAAHAIADRGARADGALGTIRVATKRGDGTVSIVVSDDGCGMTPEVRARMYDPFFTTKEVGRGTGQGLAIARRIIDKLCGRIECESTVGVGTTFTLTVPVARGRTGLRARSLFPGASHADSIRSLHS